MLFLTRREKFIGIILIILAALVIACGIGSKGADGKWFQNSDVSTWFNSWGKATEIVQTVDTNEDEQQPGTSITIEENNGAEQSGNAAETPAVGDQNADNSTENNGSVQNVETVEGETGDNGNGETTSEDVPV